VAPRFARLDLLGWLVHTGRSGIGRAKGTNYC